MSLEGQSSFLLQLETEQIPNSFDVKLNADGTILDVLQNKFLTREIGESVPFFFSPKISMLEGVGIECILTFNKSKLKNRQYLCAHNCAIAMFYFYVKDDSKSARGLLLGTASSSACTK